MRRYAIVGFAILGLSLVRPAGVQAEEFFIAHWNVENLFDTVDDPNVSGDEEFTPDGPKHWDDKRLETKVDNLSKIICKMNDGHGPDVLGLCEVENRKVVEMLVAKLGTLGRDYQIVHKDSPSERGIDCALVYDAKVFKLADSKFHHVDAGNTRDIVEAKLENGGVPLYVFVDHWPAQTHDEDQRSAAADVLRKRLDEILAADPKADAVAIGDFNEDPDSVALKDHLHAVDSSDQMPAGAVFDTLALVHAAGKGTFVWDDKWQMLDHIILTPGMLDEAGYHWKADSSQPVEFPEQLFHSKREGAIDSPSKSYSKNNFHTDGYSDHLPVSCTIVK
jgi:endonuclease/exonuclease/phosphatase family metal-dependent hydrolase